MPVDGPLKSLDTKLADNSLKVYCQFGKTLAGGSDFFHRLPTAPQLLQIPSVLPHLSFYSGCQTDMLTSNTIEG
jgi:hypothetical protein